MTDANLHRGIEAMPVQSSDENLVCDFEGKSQMTTTPNTSCRVEGGELNAKKQLVPPLFREAAMARKPSKARVRQVINEVDDLDLPDGAHWALIHDRLGLEYGEVFDIMAEDPEYFGDTP